MVSTRYVATEEQIRERHERYEVIPGTFEVRKAEPGQVLTAVHVQTDSFDFTDVFTFNIAGPVTVNASLVTIGAGLNNIDFLSANLNGNPLTLSPNGFIETGMIGDTGLTGPLVLTVTGKSGEAGGTFASYSGTMNVATIPEPGSWALLMAGMACVAVMARRRLTV
jgi:hypothetical protein